MSSLKNVYDEKYENAVLLKKFFKDGAMKDVNVQHKLGELVTELQQINMDIVSGIGQGAAQYRAKKYEKRQQDNLQRIKMQINEIIQRQQGTSMAFFLKFLEKV